MASGFSGFSGVRVILEFLGPVSGMALRSALQVLLNTFNAQNG